MKLLPIVMLVALTMLGTSCSGADDAEGMRQRDDVVALSVSGMT